MLITTTSQQEKLLLIFLSTQNSLFQETGLDQMCYAMKSATPNYKRCPVHQCFFSALAPPLSTSHTPTLCARVLSSNRYNDAHTNVDNGSGCTIKSEHRILILFWKTFSIPRIFDLCGLFVFYASSTSEFPITEKNVFRLPCAWGGGQHTCNSTRILVLRSTS